MLVNCDTVYRCDIVWSGGAFFRSWKRRHGRRVKLTLAPSRDGSIWRVAACVPHERLEFGAADIELAVLVEDYRPESFDDRPSDRAARRAARRADGYGMEADGETVSAAAGRIERAPAHMKEIVRR